MLFSLSRIYVSIHIYTSTFFLGKEKSKSKKKMKTLDSLLRNEDEIEDLTLHPHIDALNIDDCNDIHVGVSGYDDED